MSKHIYVTTSIILLAHCFVCTFSIFSNIRYIQHYSSKPIVKELVKVNRVMEATFTDKIRCTRIEADSSVFTLGVIKSLIKYRVIPTMRFEFSGLQSFCNTHMLITPYPSSVTKLLKKLSIPVRYLTFVIFRDFGNYNKAAFLKNEVFKNRRTIIAPIEGSYVYSKSELSYTFTKTTADNYTLPVESNYTGQEITVSTFNCTIYSHSVSDPQTGQVSELDGVEMRFFQIMAEHLNLRVKYKFATGHGSLSPNGSYSWGSAKHAVTAGMADVGFCEFWVTPDLYHKVDMLRPWHKCCVRYLVPKPSQVRYLYAGLESIPPMFWIILIILMAVSTPLMKLLSTLEFSNPNPVRRREVPWWYWPVEMISIVLTGFPTSKMISTSRPCRILVVSWSFLSLLFLAIYSSKLISHMNEPTLRNKIQTEEEMMDAGWTWSVYDIKMNSTDYIYPKETDLIRRWISKHQHDKNMEDRVNKMKTKKYAIYGESIKNIYYLPEKAKPPDDILETYEAADTCVISYSITIMMRKWSGFSPAFRKLFSRLSDSGIPEMLFSSVMLSHRMKKYVVSQAFNKAGTSSGGSKKNVKDSLGLDVMIGIFLILMAGSILATIVFVIELISYRGDKEIKNKIMIPYYN